MGNARCIVIELDPYQSCLGKGLGSTSKFDSFALVPLSNDKVLSRRKKGKRITWSMSWQKPRNSYAHCASSSLRLCKWSLLARFFFCKGMCAHNCFLFLKHLFYKNDPTWKSISFFVIIIHMSIHIHLQVALFSPCFTCLDEPTTNKIFFFLFLDSTASIKEECSLWWVHTRVQDQKNSKVQQSYWVRKTFWTQGV